MIASAEKCREVPRMILGTLETVVARVFGRFLEVPRVPRHLLGTPYIYRKNTPMFRHLGTSALQAKNIKNIELT